VTTFWFVMLGIVGGSLALMFVAYGVLLLVAALVTGVVRLLFALVRVAARSMAAGAHAATVAAHAHRRRHRPA
jgi:hypothetical protein